MIEVIKGKPWEFNRKKGKRYRKIVKNISKNFRGNLRELITDGKISLYEKEIFYFQIDWKENGSY